MKPNITISIDDLGVMTIRSVIVDEFLDEIRLSCFEIDALRDYFANEVAA